jgi:hypothetical protein
MTPDYAQAGRRRRNFTSWLGVAISVAAAAQWHRSGRISDDFLIGWWPHLSSPHCHTFELFSYDGLVTMSVSSEDALNGTTPPGVWHFFTIGGDGLPADFSKPDVYPASDWHGFGILFEHWHHVPHSPPHDPFYEEYKLRRIQSWYRLLAHSFGDPPVAGVDDRGRKRIAGELTGMQSNRQTGEGE